MIPWLNDIHRTCQCHGNALNCLSAKEWVKAMIGVWEFKYMPTDIRDKSVHPATFPIALAKRVISLFSHKGDVIFDPFAGTGTTLLAARQLERHAIGCELNAKYCTLIKKRILNQRTLMNLVSNTDIHVAAIHDDARNSPKYIPPNTLPLIFTSPPYGNLLDKERTNKSQRNRKTDRLGINEQYSNDHRDFGTLAPTAFFEAFGRLCQILYPLLQPKGHLVINMCDIKNNATGEYTYVIPNLEIHLRQYGYLLKNVIIWDKRNLIQNTGIFGYPSNFISLNATFEYICDFVKKDM